MCFAKATKLRRTKFQEEVKSPTFHIEHIHMINNTNADFPAPKTTHPYSGGTDIESMV